MLLFTFFVEPDAQPALFFIQPAVNPLASAMGI